LATILQEHPEYGIDVVGFADRAPRVEDHSQLPAPWLGDYDDIPELIVDYNVRKVIVAFGALQESQLVELLWTCDRLECEIFFVPRLFEMQHTSRDMDNVWGVPLVRFRRAAFRTFSWKLKRVVDLVLGAVALIVFSPILAMCALAVRLEGGRGVLFRQQRVGLDGRPFMMLKFRSLRPASEHEAAVTWNISCDDRLGPVGRFLRRTSLDELPQLWNVVTGKMSLVGPRPERPHFVSEFSAHIPRYTGRHRVPAGLTGWAQIHHLRGDTSISDRASFDNFYIENWSLWGDLKILVRTVESVLMRAGG
jgi:exopolysaccharide biosynthesis polyprenyl glycosylphosphotransferase